jgi:hypothetical protein
MLKEGLQALPVQAMVKAVDKLTQEFNVLPTPVLVLKIAKDTASVMREQEAAKEKRENQQAQTNALDPQKQRTEIGKDTCLLIRAKLADRIDDQKFIEGLRHLHGKYPQGNFAVTGCRVRDRIDAKEAHMREGR